MTSVLYFAVSTCVSITRSSALHEAACSSKSPIMAPAVASVAVPSLSSSSRRRRLTPSSSITSQSFPSPSPLPPPSSSPSPPRRGLPLRKIPGDYGLPFVGALRDRLAFFYSEGRDAFFHRRVRLHQSTVVRLNMPPGPFVAPDPRVIALLDAASFPVLFDAAAVEKRDLFTGTFMPSTALTGGHRVLSYLDVDEPSHALLKRHLFSLLASRRNHVLPEFKSSYAALFDALETEIKSKGKADFGAAHDSVSFDFLIRAFFGVDPAESDFAGAGPGIVNKWIVVQLSPLMKLGLPALIEDVALHTFRLPSALVKRDYDRLAGFFGVAAGAALDEAERLGVSRDEALHNLIFAICFNTFGGMKLLFPNLIKWVGRAGARVHGRLAAEVRSAVRDAGGVVTVQAMETAMPLVKSVVYEVLRMEPPVPMQFARARRDMVVESHDYGYEVKAGELLFGYQPMATKDPRVMDRAGEFVADRFVGEEGQRLLKYVVWSNGPETAQPTEKDKQCAGKDFVLLVARLLVVELFLRYDSLEIEIGESALGDAVRITSLKKATF